MTGLKNIYDSVDAWHDPSRPKFSLRGGATHVPVYLNRSACLVYLKSAVQPHNKPYRCICWSTVQFLLTWRLRWLFRDCWIINCSKCDPHKKTTCNMEQRLVYTSINFSMHPRWLFWKSAAIFIIMIHIMSTWQKIMEQVTGLLLHDPVPPTPEQALLFRYTCTCVANFTGVIVWQTDFLASTFDLMRKPHNSKIGISPKQEKYRLLTAKFR